MNTRLVSPWKRPNSSFFWFRMVVPPRYRAAVGKREIKQSLQTADLGEARRLCAINQSKWLARFEAIDANIEVDAGRRAREIVDSHFQAESERHGGLDKVVSYELECAAVTEKAMIPCLCAEDLGLPPGTAHPLLDGSYPHYLEKEEREAIFLRQAQLRGTAAILPGLEAVKRARSIEAWHIAANFLSDALEAAGLEIDADERLFAIAAEHYLRRLAEHPLPDLEPLKTAFPLPAFIQPTASTTRKEYETVKRTSPRAVPETTIPNSDLRERILGQTGKARTLSEVFEAWTAEQPSESRKLCDEWGVAIRRFIELFGDRDVSEITTDMIVDYREAMRRLPSRPRRAVAQLPLLEQINVARCDGLRCLSGATVGKLVSGIRVTLAYACDPLRLIGTNPAASVSVTNATSDTDARLAFEPDELASIYSSSLITDAESKLSDTEFWLLVLAPLTGFRIEEMAKLRPHNIRCERGIWYVRIERDSRRKRREQTDAGEASKRSKTRAAYRDVPIHWILVEAGFVTFVENQQKRECEWLFNDLVADQYGNRSKAVSRRLIRRIRKLGIEDEEKVFHSFRHSMKRACRHTSMKEEIADLLTGHAPVSVGRKYGAGAALDVLHECVNMIEYDTVCWDRVILAAKQRQAKQLSPSLA